jgi:hypothetical protein
MSSLTTSPRIALLAGALQLLPENADYLLRLQRLAAIAASSSLDMRESSSNLRKLLTTEPVFSDHILAQEDAFEDVVVDRLTFGGRDYLVSSGLAERSCWVAERILNAILSPDGRELPPSFRVAISQLARPLLEISNRVFSLAGLEGGQPPIQQSPNRPLIPGRDRLKVLSELLTFQTERLERAFGKDLLSQLTFTQQELEALFEDEPVSEHLDAAPFVRDGDTTYLVNPLGIAACIRIQTLIAAKNAGVSEQLGSILHAEVTRWSILQVLGYGWRLQGVSKLDSGITVADFTLSESASKIKLVIHCDDLLDSDPETPFAPWSQAASGAALAEYFAEENQKRGELTGTLTYVVVLESYGRSVFAGVPADAPPNILLTNGPDLRALLLIEPHPLGVERFTSSLDRLEATTRIFSFSNLDIYAIYRDHEDSFYFGDGPKPNLINFTHGSGTDLREDAFRGHAQRYVTFPYLNWSIRTKPKYTSQRTPIYASDQGTYALVNGENCFWVAPGIDERSMALDETVTEAVTYWLWTLMRSLRPSFAEQMSTLGGRYMKITQRRVEDAGPELRILCSRSPSNDWEMLLDGDLDGKVAEPGNSVDREIVRSILPVLIESINADPPSPDEASRIIDQAAPRGNKTMLSVYSSDNLLLWPGGLGRPRFVENSVTSSLLDDLGEWLREEKKFSVGEISDSDRTSVLNMTVQYYMDRLVKEIAELKPDGLIELLVDLDESLLFDSEYEKASLAPRVACWEGFVKADDLVKRRQRSVESAIASRFLIEYVVAQPPTGNNDLYIEKYETLLALCSEIINRGMSSDAVQYGLADLRISILESGRLGIGRDEDSFYSAIHDLVRDDSQRNLRYAAGLVEAPTFVDQMEWTPSDQIDSAFEVEFGFRLSELVAGLNHLARLEWPPSERSVTVRPVAEVRQVLAGDINWTDQKIDRFLAELTLLPRAKFIPDRSRTDVYPWRFNRNLSYLRRPLLIRSKVDGDELVWGPRHLIASVGYWINLVRGARLRAESVDLQRALGIKRNELTEAFNDHVGDILSGVEHLQVQTRAKKIGGKRVSDSQNRDLGDIDVLCVNHKSRTVWVIETKDFEVARTPAEAGHEIEKLLSGEKSTVTLHARRTEWVRSNLSSVINQFNLTGRGWTVQSAIVLNEDLISARLASRAGTRIVPVDDVVKLIGDPRPVKQTKGPRSK